MWQVLQYTHLERIFEVYMKHSHFHLIYFLAVYMLRINNFESKHFTIQGYYSIIPYFYTPYTLYYS